MRMEMMAMTVKLSTLKIPQVKVKGTRLLHFFRRMIEFGAEACDRPAVDKFSGFGDQCSPQLSSHLCSYCFCLFYSNSRRLQNSDHA